MNRYQEGIVVVVSVIFTDTSGAFIDPTAVFLKIEKPDETVVQYQYGVGQNIVKDSIGHYHTNVDTTALVGNWAYEWKSTGTGQTATSNRFYVFDVVP